ncbi:hypothetical protein ACFV0H_29970 [Streptomyces erythrochromogenes]|uniref:hypothetical protein n=1 Tax=Streptomyces erythrochromogenes TaxID=285574 RepID=UPI0036973BC1
MGITPEGLPKSQPTACNVVALGPTSLYFDAAERDDTQSLRKSKERIVSISNLRRAALLCGVVSIAWSGSMLGTASAAEALTDYDKVVLSQQGRKLMEGGIPPVSNAAATEYCDRAGYGTGEGQCQLQKFLEEERLGWIPNWSEQVSDLTFNCATAPLNKEVGWSRENSASHLIGGEVGLSVSTGGKVSVGIVAGAKVGASVSANYHYAWGASSGESSTDILTVRPGYVGWFAKGGFRGTAHGVADVAIVNVKPKFVPEGSSVTPGHYKIVTDISGDLWKPERPEALAAQSVVGIIAQARPMTQHELELCSSNPNALNVKASGGKASESHAISS